MKDAHLHFLRLPHYQAVYSFLEQTNYQMTTDACTFEEWDALFAFTRNHPEINTAYGIHPESLQASPSDWISKLRTLLKADIQADVGETGLDKRYLGYKIGGSQETFFTAQAKLAQQFRRTLIIHCVGDYHRLLHILGKLRYAETNSPILFHRFAGDESVIQAARAFNVTYSIHTSSLRKKSTVRAISHIPLENIVFETDADQNFAIEETSPEAIANKLISQLKGTQKAFESLYRNEKSTGTTPV